MVVTDVTKKLNETKLTEKQKYDNMKAKLHDGCPPGDFPYIGTDRLQLKGFSSECKHSFQCGQLRAICTNPKCKTRFCFWGWYTAGLIPDQLCPWYEANPNWRSISVDYFTNRQSTIMTMLNNKLITEEIPDEAYGYNSIGERLFKPLTVWIFGADLTVTKEQLEAEFPWLHAGIGTKNIFRVPYESIERTEQRILKLIPKAEGFGFVPNIYYQWNTPPAGFIEHCTQFIREREDIHNVNIVTRLVHSQRIQRNELMNLTWLNRSLWAYKLKDVFKDRIIMCVAGGPSLTEQIPIIKANRDKFVLICVSTVAEILFKNDIVPDIIGTIDMKSDNIKYLEFLTEEQMTNSYFLFEIDAHHSVVDAYKGPKIMLVADLLHTPITALINDYLNMDTKDIVPKSGTVANMIYNFAKITSPREIWLVGYDLCYPKSNSHVDGMRLNKHIDIVDGNGGKFIKYENSDHVDAAFEVDTNDGGKGYTPKAFKTYLTELNIRIKEAPIVKTYDLTPIGATKEGAPFKPITDLIEHLPNEPINTFELLSKIDIKLLPNKIVKKLIKSPVDGNNKRIIREVHETKLTYLIRQYLSNDILIHDSIINDLNQETDRRANANLTTCVEKALLKFKGVN